MKKVILTLIIFIGIIHNIKSQCISGNCDNGNGVYLYEDKSRYEGEWRNGKPNGKGKYYYSTGESFDGLLQDGVKNGYGKYIYSGKDYYQGNFKNNKPEGAGKYVTSDGDIYQGQYKDGKLNGIGSITQNTGDKYTGSIVDDLPDGNGTYYYSSGDKFEGSYKKGQKNGSGVLYYQKGGTLKGIWVDGLFVSGSDKPNFIQLNKTSGGVYEVPILINGVLKFEVIFDTGAAEVFLTPDVILTLIRTKTISEKDILEGKNFIDANGNINKNIRINLREIKLGSRTLSNVPCGVSETINGLSLLGLSAIEGLGNIEIDFKSSTLRIR